MNTRKIKALCLLLAGLMLLGGCAPQMTERSASGVPLPDIQLAYPAPTGDKVADRSVSCVLYYIDAEGNYLVPASADVTVRGNEHLAEAVVRTLLQSAPQEGLTVFSEDVQLSDRTMYPVYVSGEVAVVSLAETARRLSPEELHMVRTALANTLTEVPGIEYACILIGGLEEGVDLSQTMPAGALSRSLGNDLGAQWNQLELQRQQSQQQGFSKPTALFLPAAGGNYLTVEVRNIAYPSVQREIYAVSILQELSKGGESGRIQVPSLLDYLLGLPQIVEPQGEVGRVMRLNFTQELEEALLKAELRKGVFLAMLTQTLLTFIPGIEGLQVQIGSELIEALAPVDTLDWQGASFVNQTMTRGDFEAYVGARAQLRFVQESGRLGIVSRALPLTQGLQPRAYLRLLIEGPQPWDADAALFSPFPEAVTEADILAVEIIDDIALVNLSQAFYDACQDLSAQQERNLIYAMVNTLTGFAQVARAAFFFEGEQVETLAGALEMGGVFYRSPGIESEVM